MKRTLMAVAVAAAAAVAMAQGPGFGPGGDGGYGPGGCGAGYGSGYGPGMMGGGPGRGPMMGHGGGPGMRGERAGPALPGLADLSDAQRERIQAIREQHRRDVWDTMGQIRTERFKLRGLYAADKVDPDAVVDQHKRIDELQLKMTRARVVEHNEILAVLTPEQRKSLRQRGPWRMREGDG